jgi:hypothetical protein
MTGASFPWVPVLLVGAVGAALVHFTSPRTFHVEAGKRYRVTSKLRGQRSLALIESGLAELGATDLVLEEDVVRFTKRAGRTEDVRLGVDAFVFEDPKQPGVVARLVVDDLEDAA